VAHQNFTLRFILCPLWEGIDKSYPRRSDTFRGKVYLALSAMFSYRITGNCLSIYIAVFFFFNADLKSRHNAGTDDVRGTRRDTAYLTAKTVKCRKVYKM
jgi:hypothetical protein